MVQSYKANMFSMYDAVYNYNMSIASSLLSFNNLC